MGHHTMQESISDGLLKGQTAKCLKNAKVSFQVDLIAVILFLVSLTLL